MLGLPKSTEISKQLPKKAIFDRFKPSPADQSESTVVYASESAYIIFNIAGITFFCYHERTSVAAIKAVTILNSLIHS